MLTDVCLCVYRFGDYTKYPEEPTVGTAWYQENVSIIPNRPPPAPKQR
jgi:hypothetical protein